MALSRREQICLVVGMTVFWAYFRYPTVMQTMFSHPRTSTLPLSPTDALAAFLAITVALSAPLVLTAMATDRLLDNRRWLVCVLGAAGSVGICLNYALGAVAVGSPEATFLFWLSTLLFAVGFLANVLAWGRYCSRAFSLQVFALLALSFVLSLLLFSVVGTYLPAAKPPLVVAIPLVTQVMWLLCARSADGRGSGKPETGQPGETDNDFPEGDLPKSKLIYVLLFVIFLLCGSLVRGIVDMQGTGGGGMMFRLGVSVVLLGLMAAFCFIRKHRFEESLRVQGHSGTVDALSAPEILAEEIAEVERLVLKCWVFLAFVFVCGLLLGFVLPRWDFGGNLVVVARSGLDFLLWVLLCNLVHEHQVPSTRTFVVFFVLSELISWLLSYVLIPSLSAMGGHAPEQLVETLLVIIMFLLVGGLTILFAWVALRKQSVFNAPAIPTAAPGATAPEPAPIIPDSKVKRYHLTSREVEVMSLFSQGYSLAKVSQELYISLGTAQSHMKNIYRKMDVHSKDELISLIAGWDER
ncbi:MAG: helix-turn-helix transcriptional regulator [Eggerthellaceae bacterium]|nr:helix-turn-helix transcriptional regulator [Eggerthellaceae bacterium]